MHRLLLAALALLTAAPIVQGQDWPSKPVRLIVPFAAGSVAEAIFRPLAPGIEGRLGQRFVIDNRPGADAVIGTEHAMRSAPDGYTFLIGSTSVFAVKQHMIKDLGFDPLTAFEPVSMLAEAPLIAVVGPGVPARTLKEMADHVRANIGKFNYGAQGAGSPTHLTGTFFSQQTGNSLVFIPYKGTPQLVTGLLSGDIHIAFPTLTAVAPQIRAGKLRVLAAMSRQRMPELPDVPSAAEAGFPQLATTNWWMVAAPAGTPPAIIDRFGGEIRAELKNAEVRKRLAAIGQAPMELSPAETSAFLKAESARYKTIVEKGGVTRQ